ERMGLSVVFRSGECRPGWVKPPVRAGSTRTSLGLRSHNILSLFWFVLFRCGTRLGGCRIGSKTNPVASGLLGIVDSGIGGLHQFAQGCAVLAENRDADRGGPPRDRHCVATFVRRLDP